MLILLITIICISSVSAEDISNGVVLTGNSVSAEDISNDIDLTQNSGFVDEYVLNEDIADKKLNDDSSKDIIRGPNVANFTEFQALINSASSGSTVNLDKNYAYVEGDSISGVEINNQITINGNGFTLNGMNASRILYNNAEGLILKNIIFRDAYYSDFSNSEGGAVFSTKSFTVQNCTFINGHSDCGGAICSYGDLTVSDSLFIDNSPFYSSGGAICTYRNLTVLNSNFYNNTADWGAALTTCRDAVVRNCNFTDNYVSCGGVIEAYDSLEVYDSRFINNTAEYTSAAIYAKSFTLVDNCEFIKNTAVSGGGIYNFGNTTVLNSRFINNSAETAGGIYSKDSSTMIINSSFINNNASKAGAIFGGTAINCTFDNNAEPKTLDCTLINPKVNKKMVSLSLSQSGSYYGEKLLTITVNDLDSNRHSEIGVIVKFSNGKTVNLTTDSNGKASYSIPFVPGTYTATAIISDTDYASDSFVLSGIKIVKAPVTISPTKLSTTYGSGKYFQIKVINSKSKKAVSGVKLKLKVYTGKKYKTVTVTSNSKGIAQYSASTLAVGNHKIVVTNAQTGLCTGSSKTSSVKISKAKLTISAPAVTNAYKQTESFKVTVKNSQSGKGMAGVKLTIKIDRKKYTRTTNSNGVASISTKSLSKGSHKVSVAVSATAKYYKASKSSSIKINQKYKTKITINSCYRTGGMAEYFIKTTLKDERGKALAKKKVTIKTIITFDEAKLVRYTNATTDSSGVFQGYVNAMLGGIVTYDISVSFAGDDYYFASTSESRHLD